MATYVLVHGAWGGAHTFRLVRPLLREAGHEVFTPSLTGIGERAHLASPQVDLSTHVLDVANALYFEDLQEVVLLGFSYGGMVVTGALEHVADRVRHLVYLDAFVPANGESLNDMNGNAPARGGLFGRSWLVPPLGRAYEDPERADWEGARRTSHPAGCFDEPVRLEKALEEFPFTRTYVKATGEARPDSNAAFWAAADRYRSHPAWSYREVDTNHLIPVNRPKELAAILLALAG